MLNIIIELSKYLILILIALYTLESFTVFKYEDDYDKRYILRKQLLLIVFMDFTAFLVIFLKEEKLEIVYLFGALLLYLVVVQGLYRLCYKKASILLLNHMCMLLSIGFIMLARLSPDSAKRQFIIVAAATVIAMIVPILIKNVFSEDVDMVLCSRGIGAFAGGTDFWGQCQRGKNQHQPGFFRFSAFRICKDYFVFFVASRLYKKSAQFKDHVITTIVAAVHVLVLVLSRDLGSAVVFFITYVVMLYVATKKPVYLVAGLGSGALAAIVAYFLFSHVQQRVIAWKAPFSVYESSGYQIVQGLFAIGAGGWFGMGLCQGSPEMIPFVKQDYMFAAICEELGGLFAICMILICMSMFLLVVNISLRIKKRFYKLIALGLGTEYAFQVFLTIGGVSKFIPMTGITLPLVSYGGSSALSTIIMLAIIQGLYILREDEDEELEKQK